MPCFLSKSLVNSGTLLVASVEFLFTVAASRRLVGSIVTLQKLKLKGGRIESSWSVSNIINKREL